MVFKTNKRKGSIWLRCIPSFFREGAIVGLIERNAVDSKHRQGHHFYGTLYALAGDCELSYVLDLLYKYVQLVKYLVLTVYKAVL